MLVKPITFHASRITSHLTKLKTRNKRIENMLTIKVLGPGCGNCQRVEAAARNAVASLGADAKIIKVTDYADMMTYNILATPGLVVNEKLVAAGRIPQEAEIVSWVADALAIA
jgi:small redox-active disulfide protein 2